MKKTVLISNAQLNELAPGFLDNIGKGKKFDRNTPDNGELGETTIKAEVGQGQNAGQVINDTISQAKNDGLGSGTVEISYGNNQNESKKHNKKPIKENKVKMTWGQLLTHKF